MLLASPGRADEASWLALDAQVAWSRIQERWPDPGSQSDQEARRLELVLLLHRLREKRLVGAADPGEDLGIRWVQERLDAIEEASCDRRDRELRARFLELPPQRVEELAEHLERHREARSRGRTLSGLDLFRPVEICRYR